MASDYENTKANLELQERIAAAIKESTKGLQSFADAQKTVAKNYKIIKEMLAEMANNEKVIAELEEEAKNATEERKKLIAAEIAGLKKVNEGLRQEVVFYQTINKELAKKRSLLKAVGNDILSGAKMLKDKFIPSLSEVFEKFIQIDALAHQTANTIGFQGERFKFMKDNIDAVQDSYINMGFALEDAYNTQMAISEATGRQTMLSKEAADSVAQGARITGMALDQYGGLIGNMEAFGLGLEQSSESVIKLSREAAAMGLNSSNVLKKFQQNLGLMNKLNFKAGIAGLQKMTKFSEKYKLDMSAVASVADKVFRPEGAIEAAAQLQVLGGSLAALGDPFQLMYKARNAPEELAESLTKAAQSSATFNKKTGEFEVNAYELDRMREAAQALGMDYTQLVETAKQGAKIKKFEGLLGGRGLDEETMDALTGAAQLGKDGEAFVTIKGVKQPLKDLTTTQIDLFKQQKLEREKAAEEAMALKDDFEKIKNKVMSALVHVFEALPWDAIISGLTKAADFIAGAIKWMQQTFSATGAFAALLAIYFGPKIVWPLLQGMLFSKSAGAGLTAAGGVVAGEISAAMTAAGTTVAGEIAAASGGKAMGAAGGAISTTTGAAGAGMKGFQMSSMLQGAAAILVLSAALFVFAKALQEFDKLQNGWGTLAMAGVGLAGLAVGVYAISKIPFESLMEGSIALAAMGLAFVPLAFGLSLLQGLSWDVLGMAGVALLGLTGAVFGLGALLSTGIGAIIFIEGVAGFMALGASLVVLGLGLAAVTAPIALFMSVVGDGTALLNAGLGVLSLAAGIGILTLSLIAMGAASLLALPGLLILGEVTSMLTETASALASTGGGEGLSKAVSAINSVDTTKLQALKELSLFMSLLGASPTIKFDESLKIDGSIEITGQAGGKSNTNWVEDPLFVSALKGAIADATKADKNGGVA